MSPRTTSSAPPTLVRVDPAAGAPLYRQIYDSLRDAVVAGRLRPGARVPPTRVLAHELQVSRNTTSAALAQLRAEGYLEVRPRSGAFVSPLLPDTTLAAPRPREHPTAPGHLASGAARPETGSRHPALSRHGTRLATLASPSGGAARPFRIGVPALDAFPWELWARLTSPRLRRSPDALSGYGASAGYAPLREAIAASVAAARGAVCTAAQVIITSGTQQALDLVARLLVDEGDAVWLEDPGYPGARAAFAAVGPPRPRSTRRRRTRRRGGGPARPAAAARLHHPVAPIPGRRHDERRPSLRIAALGPTRQRLDCGRRLRQRISLRESTPRLSPGTR
jgi:GntR family transcriptional regulator/MocR family aminotransferase